MDGRQEACLFAFLKIVTNPYTNLGANDLNWMCRDIIKSHQDQPEAIRFLAKESFDFVCYGSKKASEIPSVLLRDLAHSHEALEEICSGVKRVFRGIDITAQERVAPLVSIIALENPATRSALAACLADVFCFLSRRTIDRGELRAITNGSQALIEVGGKEELCRALEAVKMRSPSAASFLTSIKYQN